MASSKSFASNMISIHLWILFSFGIIKCFVLDSQIKDMYKYTSIFIILLSTYFFAYLWFWNAYLTKSSFVCGNFDFSVTTYATLIPFIFIYVLGISMITLFNGWTRSFSNTFGLTFIRMCGYDEYISEYMKKSKENNSQGIYDKIYNNPTIFINELELNKENESTFMDHLKNAGFNTEDTENINIMKKFVTMKNTVGTFMWIILFSIITILTSQNTLLNQSCSKKIVDQKGFSDYVNSQLEESTSNT